MRLLSCHPCYHHLPHPITSLHVTEQKKSKVRLPCLYIRVCEINVIKNFGRLIDFTIILRTLSLTSLYKPSTVLFTRLKNQRLSNLFSFDRIQPFSSLLQYNCNDSITISGLWLFVFINFLQWTLYWPLPLPYYRVIHVYNKNIIF